MSRTAVAPGPSRPLLAALWMLGALSSFALMTVAGRELTAELDTFEIMTWRSAIGLAIVLALLWRGPGFAAARTRLLSAHLVRNTAHFAGQNLWYVGVATIPLAQLTALEFTSPIWVAMLAPLALGERLTGAKLVAALLGFAGVLVIARPDAAPVEWGHVAALGSAVGFAITSLATKRIMRTESALCVVFWMTLMQLVMATALAAPGGIDLPSAPMVPWMLLTGLTGLSAHFCLTQALGVAPITVVAPMDFLRLPVIAALGLALYGEPVGLALAAGAALILLANVLNVRAARAT